MAAGMGSRFGSLKQMQSVDEMDRGLLEYSVFDAKMAGFDRVVFIIRKFFAEEFKEKIEEGGFILAHWDGTVETEEKIKEETKATIRCIPLEGDTTPGVCMVTGKPSARRVIFARAY